jgi:5-methylthioadenosine/S-adenosylhomocysteine deaminase
VLAAGRPADLVLFDMDRPHLYPRHNLVANVVHGARASDVTHVMVDGRWLYRNGELLTLDEEKIKAEADQRAKRMVTQNMRIVREYRA